MLKRLNISCEDIIRNIKLSCQIPGVVEAIATQKIIADAAQDAGIKVSEEELQQEGDSLRLEKKLVQAKDTWAWLKKHHLSLDDFEELANNNVLYKKLANHLFADKVERFFYEHQLNYVAAVTYEVIFDDRDLALELFYALQEREITFQEIARSYIQNPELRRASGYQGIKLRTDFRPEIAAAIFAATPPEILKPIITPKGVHLIWLEEIIQPKLDEEVRQNIIKDMFSTWLKQQIEIMEIITLTDSESSFQGNDKFRKQA